MSNTTRISDLPENIKMTTNETVQNTSYSPMNMHPNPYGNSNNPNVMPLPQDQVNNNNYLPPNETHTLPSRDIPIDTNVYQQDEQIQPNYIPKQKLNNDFIREYEIKSKEHFEDYNKQKHRESLVDIVFTELQLPIFIATLYFIFNMPIVNSFFYKNLSFLSIYYTDGNINFNGILLKSLLFGLVFYSLNSSIQYILTI